MGDGNLNEATSVKASILSVLQRIRAKPSCRKLLSPDFSLALNAVGEPFVDLLLQRERKGRWWLTDDGEWHECSIRTVGRRVPRNFLPGPSSEWGWFPATKEVRHIADRLTGPDHVVTATVHSLKLSVQVVLEQKLRFGKNDDVLATAATYVKHLRHGVKGKDTKPFPMPGEPSKVDQDFIDRLLEGTKNVLLREKKKGVLSHSGSVPQVCFVSVQTPPHKVFVCDKEYKDTLACEAVGFLAPIVNHGAFADDSVSRRIVQQARVRLWLDLESLLVQCEAKEVEEAWCSAIEGLSASVRKPKWMA